MLARLSRCVLRPVLRRPHSAGRLWPAQATARGLLCTTPAGADDVRTLSVDGDAVVLHWAHAEPGRAAVSRFHFSWLRDHAPENYHPVSKQRLLHSAESHSGAEVAAQKPSVSLAEGPEGGALVLDWAVPGREPSHIPLPWLRAHCYSEQERQYRYRQRRQPKLWSQANQPQARKVGKESLARHTRTCRGWPVFDASQLNHIIFFQGDLRWVYGGWSHRGTPDPLRLGICDRERSACQPRGDQGCE